MMENRSFDHMLGSLKAVDPRINGLTGNETNPDTTNEPAPVKPQAEWMSQLDPDPDHHFPAVHKQLYYGTPYFTRRPAMSALDEWLCAELLRSAKERQSLARNHVLFRPE